VECERKRLGQIQAHLVSSLLERAIRSTEVLNESDAIL
jgi:hypothetical protein